MKYIVTGGTGFIGSHLTKKLLDRGDHVTVIDNFESSSLESLEDYLGFDNLQIIKTSICGIDKKSTVHLKIKEAFDGVDTVLHLAARARVQPSIDNPVKFNAANVEGTLNMLEYSNQAKVRRFVFTSSSSLYGNTEVFPTPETLQPNPLSPYGLQKLIGEQYCQLYSRIHNLDTVCLRYFNVYGPGAPTEGAYCLVIGKFIQRALAGKNLEIFGDGQQRRDFTYVDDVINANILASESNNKFTGDVFNIGNGDNRSIQDIANVFKLPCDYLPPRIEPKETLADNSKAKEVLGWEPTGDVLNWVEGHLTNIFKEE